MNAESSPWIVRATSASEASRGERATMRLFCVPYAGGGTAPFRGWANALPGIEVCAVQMPGRESRLREAALSRIEDVVDSLGAAIGRWLDMPFAFFGHSMGALIAFELARCLENLDRGPEHLFVSACRAPHLPPVHPRMQGLSDADLLGQLQNLNGTPPEVLANAEMMQLLLPMLRADFTIVESYVYSPGVPLKCPISAFGGLSDDNVTRVELQGWREQTTSDFTLRLLAGDHFFLHRQETRLLEAIKMDLARLSGN